MLKSLLQSPHEMQSAMTHNRTTQKSRKDEQHDHDKGTTKNLFTQNSVLFILQLLIYFYQTNH